MEKKSVTIAVVGAVGLVGAAYIGAIFSPPGANVIITELSATKEIISPENQAELVYLQKKIAKLEEELRSSKTQNNHEVAKESTSSKLTTIKEKVVERKETVNLIGAVPQEFLGYKIRLIKSSRSDGKIVVFFNIENIEASGNPLMIWRDYNGRTTGAYDEIGTPYLPSKITLGSNKTTERKVQANLPQQTPVLGTLIFNNIPADLKTLKSIHFSFYEMFTGFGPNVVFNNVQVP